MGEDGIIVLLPTLKKLTLCMIKSDQPVVGNALRAYQLVHDAQNKSFFMTLGLYVQEKEQPLNKARISLFHCVYQPLIPLYLQNTLMEKMQKSQLLVRALNTVKYPLE